MINQPEKKRTGRSAQSAAGRFACMLLLACAGQHVSGAESQNSPSSEQKMNPAAMTELIRMADYVSTLQHFSYEVHGGYDVVQDDGQKIEFPETRKIAVSRPDHVRGDFINSDGSEGVVSFDGKQITLHNKSDNVSATTETLGTIDNAIETLSGKLGIRMPLAMLLSPKLPATLRDKVTAVDIVGTSSLRGSICTHIAARSEQVDIQVWVQEGDKPFPRRVVLTYRNETGQPQYRADITDWKTAATRDESLVKYKVPAGAEQFEFRAALPAKSKKGAAPKGEKQ